MTPLACRVVGATVGAVLAAYAIGYGLVRWYGR